MSRLNASPTFKYESYLYCIDVSFDSLKTQVNQHIT